MAKRLMDLVLVLGTAPAWVPICLVVAVVVRVVDGAPVLFAQERAGRDGRPFVMRKFRTMTTESEDPTTDVARITTLGARLRLTSLDELPTLIAILRGDMSLVGPRPLPIRYVERYSPEQRRRLEVVPGLTGLAQVEGRNLLSWEDRFALDVRYVDDRSVVGDLGILWRTVSSVIRADGAEAEDGGTTPEFFGGGDVD